MNLPQFTDEEENKQIQICWLAATLTESEFKKKFPRRDIDGLNVVSMGLTVEKLLKEKPMPTKMLLTVGTNLNHGLWKLMEYQIKHSQDVTDELYKTHIESQGNKTKPKTDPQRKSEKKAKKATNDNVEDILSKIDVINLDDIPEIETVFKEVNNTKDVNLMEEAPNAPEVNSTEVGYFGPLTGEELDDILNEFTQSEKSKTYEENKTGLQKPLALTKTPSKRNAPHEEPPDTPSKRSRKRLENGANEDPDLSSAVQNGGLNDLGVLPIVEGHYEMNGQNGDTTRPSRIETQKNMVDDVSFILNALDEDYHDEKKAQKKKNKIKVDKNKLIQVSMDDIFCHTVDREDRIFNNKNIISSVDYLLKMPCLAWAGPNKYKKWNLKLIKMFNTNIIQKLIPTSDSANWESQLRHHTTRKTFELSKEFNPELPDLSSRNLRDKMHEAYIPLDENLTNAEIVVPQASEVEMPIDVCHTNTGSLLTLDLTGSQNNNLVDDASLQRNESLTEWTKPYVYEILQGLWAANTRPIKFHHFAPKQTTSKQNRGLAFKYILELAGEELLRMEQDDSWGPVEIWFDMEP